MKYIFSIVIVPEYEDEEWKKSKEDHDIVHRPEHHHQLALKAGKEPDQLEDPEESEGPEDTQSRAILHPVQNTIEDFNTTATLEEIK